MKIRQWNQKMPRAIFWLAIGGFLVLMGLFASDSTWDADFPQSKALFLGAWSIGFAILWFFFGSIDWSQWNAIKRRLGKGEAEPVEEYEPIKSITRQQSQTGFDGMPTTFVGWCSALAGGFALIGLVVGVVWALCNALLQ